MQKGRKKILILDDDYSLLDALSTVFESENFSTITLSQLEEIDIEHDICLLNPDVILLDINFGKHDGMVICKKLKNNPLTSHFKVILMSAGDYEGRIADCQYDDYIQKPFNIRTLLDKVSTPLKLIPNYRGNISA